MDNFNVRFPANLLDRARAYGDRHGLKRGEVVRRAVGVGLDAMEAEERSGDTDQPEEGRDR